jgi:uncharacterized protein YegP (UPF0339 family)
MEFEVYKDAAHKFRWRLKASNGKVIADSGQGYVNKQDCLDGIQLVQDDASSATIEDLT